MGGVPGVRMPILVFLSNSMPTAKMSYTVSEPGNEAGVLADCCLCLTVHCRGPLPPSVPTLPGTACSSHLSTMGVLMGNPHQNTVVSGQPINRHVRW